jgi:hypothetical protein
MKKLLVTLALLALAASAHAADPGPQVSRCIVADPTGTPLNVRNRPHGSIVATLANGEVVDVYDLGGYGANWYYVHGVSHSVVGWIYGPYVTDCRLVPASHPLPTDTPASARPRTG